MVSQDGLVAAKEVVDEVVGISELLEGVGGDGHCVVGCTFHVVNLDFIAFFIALSNWRVGDDEVVFNSGWQDAVSAVVDVLSNDVHSTWGTAVELWEVSVLLLEPGEQVAVPWFVFGLDCVVGLGIHLVELLENGHTLNLWLFLFVLRYGGIQFHFHKVFLRKSKRFIS